MDNAPTKLLGVTCQVSLLCRQGLEYSSFQYTPNVPYISLGRTTGDVYCLALSRISSMLHLHAATEKVDLTQHIVCSDGDAAVSLGARAFAKQDDQEAFSHLRTFCSSHKASGIREAVGALPPTATQRFTHLALSLKHGNLMPTMRTAFLRVFVGMAQVRRCTAPSTAHRQHNLDTMNLFLPAVQENKAAKTNL